MCLCLTFSVASVTNKFPRLRDIKGILILILILKQEQSQCIVFKYNFIVEKKNSRVEDSTLCVAGLYSTAPRGVC